MTVAEPDMPRGRLLITVRYAFRWEGVNEKTNGKSLS